MKRRGFLRALGFGGAVAAVVAPAVASANAQPETRDLKWAKAEAAKGHRVRLESWRVPLAERAVDSPGPGVATCNQGSPQGVDSVKSLLMTVEVMEGPWERVPEADYPKPPPPPPKAKPGEFLILSGDEFGDGGSVVLQAGTGAGGNAGGQITLTGGAAVPWDGTRCP